MNVTKTLLASILLTASAGAFAIPQTVATIDTLGAPQDGAGTGFSGFIDYSVAPFDAFNTIGVELATPMAQSQTAGAGILGGFREVYLERLGGGPVEASTVIINGDGFASISNDVGATSMAVFTWDGVADSGLLDPQALANIALGGLGSQNFINDPGDPHTFAIGYSTDVAATLTLRVFQDDGGTSLGAESVVALAPGSSGEAFFDFANPNSFGAITSLGTNPDGVLTDFGDVGAIQLIIEGGAGLDLSLDFLIARTDVNVPGPAPLALLGIGLLALGAYRRRRKAA